MASSSSSHGSESKESKEPTTDETETKALAGDANAQYSMAMRYWDKLNPNETMDPTHVNEFKRWLSMAVGQKHPEALNRWGTLYLVRACENSPYTNPLKYALENRYRSLQKIICDDIPKEKSAELALKLLEEAGEKGSAEADNTLGYFYWPGKGYFLGQKNEAKSINHFERAVTSLKNPENIMDPLAIDESVFNSLNSLHDLLRENKWDAEWEGIRSYSDSCYQLQRLAKRGEFHHLCETIINESKKKNVFFSNPKILSIWLSLLIPKMTKRMEDGFLEDITKLYRYCQKKGVDLDEITFKWMITLLKTTVDENGKLISDNISFINKESHEDSFKIISESFAELAKNNPTLFDESLINLIHSLPSPKDRAIELHRIFAVLSEVSPLVFMRNFMAIKKMIEEVYGVQTKPLTDTITFFPSELVRLSAEYSLDRVEDKKSFDLPRTILSSLLMDYQKAYEGISLWLNTQLDRTKVSSARIVKLLSDLKNDPIESTMEPQTKVFRILEAMATNMKEDEKLQELYEKITVIMQSAFPDFTYRSDKKLGI